MPRKRKKIRIGKLFKRGFTLVELIVVISITVILATVIIFAVNPAHQYEKALDAERVQDLSTVATAMDTYYHDTNCYPDTVPFGSEWKNGNTIYAKEVPNDPKRETNGDYIYMKSSSSPCSQWGVVFSKLTTQEGVCSLPAGCVPSGYNTAWACKVLGSPPCEEIQEEELPEVSPTAVPATPTPIGQSGVCIVRNSSTNSPMAYDPDLGVGYAKVSKPGINTPEGLRAACTQADYDTLMQAYCSTNSSPAQQQILTFTEDGHFHTTGCSAITCNFIPCAGGGGSSPTATPTATASAH